ncbi:MAG TPA: carotenoid biosynthesis protein [Candidatus Limnocylindrales bacterium]|nr:carotenoid biosynthesis protein [Candidatus Limnocylindrales bacterium]
MNPIYLGLEIGAALFFIGAAMAALRRGRLPFLELVSAAIFGILLEEGDQILFETYNYSPEWVLVVDRSPVVIGLTWALIIAGAMRLTDALGVRRRYAPFVDAVLAISLDLAFDAIAIRMGLWTWRDIGPEQGWFGVPAGNFYAWLFVTLGFSLVTRWIRDASRERPVREWWQLVSPLPAYAILLAGLLPFIWLKPLVDNARGGGLGLFAITLLAFCAIAAWGVWGPDRVAPDGQRTAILDLRLAILTRVAIHLFFLGGLLVMGLAAQLPVLLAVAVALLVAELPLSALVHARLRHTDAEAHRRQAVIVARADSSAPGTPGALP